MSVRLIFALLSILVAGSAHASISCEIELSLRARVVTNLLQRAIEVGALSSDDLANFSQSAITTSPLQTAERDPNNFSLRNSLQRQIRLLTDLERTQVRQFTQWMVEKQTRIAKIVDQVRYETSEMFGLHEVSLNLPSNARLTTEIEMGTFQQRPVFLAFMRTPNIRGQVLLDPFHHPSTEIKPIELDIARASAPVMNLYNGFLEKDGDLFAVLWDIGKVYNLQTSERTAPKEFGFSPENPIRQMDDTTHAQFKMDGRDRFLIVRDGVLHDHEFNGNPPTKLNLEIDGHIHWIHVLQTPNSDHALLLSTAEQGALYDIRAKKLVQIQVKELGSPVHKRPSEVFAHDGGLFHVRGVDESEFVTMKLEVRNLLTGNLKVTDKAYDVAPKIWIQNIQGVPHAYLPQNEKMVVLNLITLQESSFSFPAEGIPENMQWFEYRGIMHFIWIDELKRINIFDLDSRGIVFREPLGISAKTILPFFFSGDLYALFVAERNAKLMKLTYKTLKN